MSTIHTLLYQNKPLHEWANAIVKSENWDKFMVHVKAHLLETQTLSPGNQIGISMTMDAILDLAGPPPVEDRKVSPIGLNHNLDIPRSETDTTKKE